MGSIYKITNTVNGKAYIGQTIHDAEKGRISEHLNGKSGGSRLVRRAVEKYGKESFTYEILHDGIIPEFLDDLEQEAISKFNTLAPDGYNLDTGGSNGSPSEETRRKMSKANKGKAPSLKQRRQISETLKRKKIKPPSQKGSTHNRSPDRIPARAYFYSLPAEMSLREKRRHLLQKFPERGQTTIYKWVREWEPTAERGKAPNESPHRIPAREYFYSLPAEMPLSEKSKRLREKFPVPCRATLNKWIREWHSELASKGE